MTSVVTVQKEVEKLKEKLVLKPKRELWVVTMFPWDSDKPHGKYGMQKLEIHSGKHEAVSEKEELKMLRETYDGIPVATRLNTDYWDTWEHFLKHSECRCGNHACMHGCGDGQET